MNLFWLILGLAVLVAGGEFLVKGAVGIAKRFKISTLVIGMTVVSFGTSAPELIVSVNAAVNNNPDIAIGNVIGSNIANLALVLAITVLIFPIVVDRNSKTIDWPVMMLSSILFYVFSLDNVIVFWEGFTLFTILIVFTVYLILSSKKSNITAEEDDEEDTEPKKPFYYSVGFLAVGLAGLFFGANWLLYGAVGIAKNLGMEEHLIGITIVAFGTSVPELVTSAVAAYRKETDLSIGNLIGSNIFNVMAVIGITAMVKDINVTDVAINSDMIWMLCIATAVLPLMILGKKLGRIQGILLLSTYITYISILVYLAVV